MSDVFDEGTRLAQRIGAAGRLFIFDKDHTLMHNPDGEFCNAPEEQVVLPNVRGMLAMLRDLGCQLAIASNQGGVAFGYLSYSQALRLMLDASKKVGGTDVFDFCPHHPEGSMKAYAIECECRKPRPGLLLRIMATLQRLPEDTTFVGDQETDRMAAEAAGVEFVWAKDFFGFEGEG